MSLLHSASVSLLAICRLLYPLRQRVEAFTGWRELAATSPDALCADWGIHPSKASLSCSMFHCRRQSRTYQAAPSLPVRTSRLRMSVLADTVALSVVQRHTRSAGGSENKTTRTKQGKDGEPHVISPCPLAGADWGWGWSRWAALIKPLHHLVEILRQATCARIGGHLRISSSDRRRHLKPPTKIGMSASHQR